MTSIKDLHAARYPFVWIETTEEDRLIRENQAQIDESEIQIFEWDIVSGFSAWNGEGFKVPRDQQSDVPMPERPRDALQKVQGLPENSIIFMKDFHKFFEQITIVRQARNIKDGLTERAQTIVFVSASTNIPPELKNDITVLNFEYPDEESLASIAKIIASDNEKEIEDEETDKITSALRGLTWEGAENALALSLVKHGKFDIDTLLKQRETQFKAGGIIEFGHYQEKLSDLYGLDNMIEFGLKTSPSTKARGILIYGVPGCITGDAKTYVRRGTKRKGGREYTLREAYYRFNGIPQNERRTDNLYKGKGCIWDHRYATFIPAWLGNRVGYHEVKDILFTGIRDVYRVKTKSGNTIKATLNHPFLVLHGGDENGFLPLKYLREGDQVFVRKLEKHNGGKKKINRPEINAKYHPYGRLKICNGYTYRYVKKTRLSIEAYLNGISLEAFITRLNNPEKIIGSKFLPKDVILHHKDSNPLNDDPLNIEIFDSIQEHNAAPPNFSANFGNQNIVSDEIVSIEFSGSEEVFDIRMCDPHRNMILNNFVVHNSGKSHFAKGLANALNRPCLILRFSALKDKYQGVAEGRLRDSFKTIRAVGKCIVFMDEIEAIATGISSGGDNGVGQSLYKDLLVEMEDSRGSGAYWVGTCNALEPLIQESGGAILRRFNGIFFCDLPDEEQARGIANIWEKKENVIIPNDFNLSGYTGADIAKLAETMSMMECSAEDAQKYVIPYGKAHAQELDRIRKKAEGTCIWASSKKETISVRPKRKVAMA